MDNKIRVAEYLATLNHDYFLRFCEVNDIDSTKIIPFEFQSPDDVYNCLSLFIELQFNLSLIFNCIDVWGMYLYSITDEKYHSGIKLMLQSGNPGNLIDYFDACYKFGISVVTDEVYDSLLIMYTKAFPFLSYLSKETYDDRTYPPIVNDAIKMSIDRSSRTASIPLTGRPGYDELNTEKTTSIRPVVDPKEAFEFWRDAPQCSVHFSLKIDGINTKMAFDSEGRGLSLAISRGRSTNSIDYTEAIRRMIRQKNINDKELTGRVIGESFVNVNDLTILQERYCNKDYKSPKSTAMAMLRAPSNFLPEDYKLLSFRAFSYGDLLPNEAFKALQAAGMEVPPYLEFPYEVIPKTSMDEFSSWLKNNVLDVLWQKGEELGIASDGVVMALLADINTERKDKYSDSNIAIKYDHWGAATYSSKVVDIVFEQKRVEASIVLVIEPTIMRDKNTATRVGVGSPDILIKDGVRIGDIIEFERKSEAYNVYLRKIEI